MKNIIEEFLGMSNEKKLEAINYLIVKQKDDIVVSRFYNDEQLTDRLMNQLDKLNQIKNHFKKLLVESN